MNTKLFTENIEKVCEEFPFLIDVLKNWDLLNSQFFVNIISVAKSGMSRKIRIYVLKDNRLLDCTYAISKIIRRSYDRKNHGIKVTGCSMNMIFHTLYTLSYQIHKGCGATYDEVCRYTKYQLL